MLLREIVYKQAFSSQWAFVHGMSCLLKIACRQCEPRDWFKLPTKKITQNVLAVGNRKENQRLGQFINLLPYLLTHRTNAWVAYKGSNGHQFVHNCCRQS